MHACTQITTQATKHPVDPILSSVVACCRYLYRHNYTISVPEVYYSVNRPDLQALYVDQLTQRDFSTQGSTDLWVKYLQTGRLLTQCFSRPARALLTLLSSDAQLRCGKLLDSSIIAQCAPQLCMLSVNADGTPLVYPWPPFSHASCLMASLKCLTA